MGRYQTSTMGEYARMLTEDAEHAVLFELRTPDGEGNDEWVTAVIDPMAEVGEACRELAHHLRQAFIAARAADALMAEHGIRPSFSEHMDAINAAEARYADAWAWVYGDGDEED